MIFASRRDRGADPFLRIKVQAFFAAAALALIGIGVDSSLLVGLAIVILLVGILLRFFPTKEPDDPDESSREGDAADHGPPPPREPEGPEPPQ